MLIAVHPRVFGDALSRVLARDDAEIVVCSEQAAPPAEHLEYDLAIVSSALPDDISADVVIRLPEGPSNGDALALADVIARVERICARVVR